MRVKWFLCFGKSLLEWNGRGGHLSLKKIFGGLCNLFLCTIINVSRLILYALCDIKLLIYTSMFNSLSRK